MRHSINTTNRSCISGFHTPLTRRSRRLVMGRSTRPVTIRHPASIDPNCRESLRAHADGPRIEPRFLGSAHHASLWATNRWKRYILTFYSDPVSVTRGKNVRSNTSN